jgi:quercetin dioxygenase-like cupin family protein
MKRIAALVVALAVPCAFAIAQQAKVESKGQTATVKLEQMLSGHLSELNGKYKLRLTEVRVEPGGFAGEHQHVGPGIRLITQGELTFMQGGKGGKVTVYKAGDAFFESGDVTTAVENKSGAQVTLLNFEILPAAHTGGSAIPAPR